MRVADFAYELPEELIAQHPLPDRDQSRLLVLDRGRKKYFHHAFQELPQLLRAGDVLIFNDSKVIPARLRGTNPRTGGRFEILLVEETGTNAWWAMMKPGKRARLKTKIQILRRDHEPSDVWAEVTEINAEGHRHLHFTGTPNVLDILESMGEMPLPPYVRRGPQEAGGDDVERYQTIYAQARGSVAAPTAGLHFTQPLMDRLREKGIVTGFLTLHVGLGTFAPVKAERIEEHLMHRERYVLSEPTARLIRAAREEHRRVVAVGTTTVRVLESAARQHQGKVVAGSGSTDIFIYPPCEFQVVDALITNFHLPRSTLLMLVSAFAAPGETSGREWVMRAYAEAVENRYRFFSYGDAMLLA